MRRFLVILDEEAEKVFDSLRKHLGCSDPRKVISTAVATYNGLLDLLEKNPGSVLALVDDEGYTELDLKGGDGEPPESITKGVPS